VPLSILIGALGALQIGVVASQQIPNTLMVQITTRGLMLVNDGKGQTTKEKLFYQMVKIIPQGRNVLMDAPKRN
jgi:hypothetical protein